MDSGNRKRRQQVNLFQQHNRKVINKQATIINNYNYENSHYSVNNININIQVKTNHTQAYTISRYLLIYYSQTQSCKIREVFDFPTQCLKLHINSLKSCRLKRGDAKNFNIMLVLPTISELDGIKLKSRSNSRINFRACFEHVACLILVQYYSVKLILKKQYNETNYNISEAIFGTYYFNKYNQMERPPTAIPKYN
eukprot:TRINITY_DN1326_c3_g1_i3.p1 TRINITY_DN1326_c3_g1~~TRINITY_DN1326_c3_g1_i3.p1  ORF type:complete len:196 (-),score=-7.97 TRINITY_DN1326_c3_g1_i3:154-741(-)